MDSVAVIDADEPRRTLLGGARVALPTDAMLALGVGAGGMVADGSGGAGNQCRLRLGTATVVGGALAVTGAAPVVLGATEVVGGR